MATSNEEKYVHGILEIDGELCHYQMSVGSTQLYKADSGKEYVINPSFGIMNISDLLRWTRSWRE